MLDLFAVFQKDRKCHSTKPGYVKRETRKAVVAGSFEEFAKAGELFCCSISEIQSDMYSECLQREYGTIIFSLTDLFKVYNTCYSDLCFILRVKSLSFMASSGGGGVRSSNKNWEGGYNFYLKIFLGGSVLKHFFDFLVPDNPDLQ